jgi:myo-inositol 2-dehydrogenase / D-chiro-inositol 1-dehydrogenase
MRMGLIGLGRIGAFHATTLTGLPAVSSLVVTDAVPALVTATTARLDAEPAATAEELLKSGVDGVVIAAATDAHPELILATLEAGIPTFCEKPVAQDPAVSAKILQLVESSDVPVQIGYPRRFDAAFLAARAAVEAGELGWLHTVRSTTLDPTPPPDGYLRASGGLFRDCSVHDFDAVRFVTGQDVVAAYATGSNQGAEIFSELDDVDTAATLLTLDSGALAVVSNTRYNARGYDVRLEVHGSVDSIAAGVDDRWPIRSMDPGTRFPSAAPHRFFLDRFADAFRAELAAFTEVAAGTRPSPCTVADAVETGLVAEAAALSRQQHRPVRIDEVRVREVRS